MALTNSSIEIEVSAMLCDSVVVESGKLYVQGGGWNNLTVPTFPTQVNRIGIGIVVTVPYTHTNSPHKMTIELHDADGAVRALAVGVGPEEPSKIEAQFNVGRPPQLLTGEAQKLTFAVNLDGLQFDKPDVYSFVISVDGEERCRQTFRLASLSTIQMSMG